MFVKFIENLVLSSECIFLFLFYGLKYILNKSDKQKWLFSESMPVIFYNMWCIVDDARILHISCIPQVTYFLKVCNSVMCDLGMCCFGWRERQAIRRPSLCSICLNFLALSYDLLSFHLCLFCLFDCTVFIFVYF